MISRKIKITVISLIIILASVATLLLIWGKADTEENLSLHLYYRINGEVDTCYDFYLYGNELFRLENEELVQKKNLSRSEIKTIERIISYCEKEPVFNYIENMRYGPFVECYLIVNGKLVCYSYIMGNGLVPDDAEAFFDYFQEITNS